MAWAEWELDLLKQEWPQGKSASAIAMKLKNKTRNAVIGKAHRLGLATRKDGPTNPAGAKPAYKHKEYVPVAKRSPAPRVNAILDASTFAPKSPVGQPVHISALTRDHCHDVLDGKAFMYCGKQTVDGVWCAAHRAAYYHKPEPRKRARSYR